MRVCLYNLTAGFKTGGLETFTWGFAEALADRGHVLEVVAGKGARTSPDSRVRLVSFDYVPRDRFPNFGTRFRKLAERISFARQALPYVRQGGFDAVLVNKPYDFVFLNRLRASGYAGVTCYNSGGTEFFTGDRYLARSVDLWFPCSHYNAGKVFEHYRREFTVLHNGVDTALFQPEGTEATVRARFSIPAEALLVISVGRLIGLKGVHVVIEALAAVPDAHFVVVGGGSDRERLERLAEARNVANRVHFLGEVPHQDLPAILRAANVFVQPSVGEEAFGISVAEAMACALPVIVSDGWGLREVVTDGETGLLAKPGDVAAWAASIRKLAADRTAATQIGQAARQRVVDCFTWRQAAHTFERQVEARLAGGRRA